MVDTMIQVEDATEKDENQVPDEIIEDFARCLLVAVQSYYDIDIPR